MNIQQLPLDWMAADIGATTTAYIWGIGLLAAKESNGSRKYYLHNAHGDVVQLANASGQLLWVYDYDAFGNQRDVEGYDSAKDANPFRYCGEYFDRETDTIYLRARYYNPRTGRFGQEDPIRSGINWYTYCVGNPVAFVDPLGLAPTAMEAALMAEHIYGGVDQKSILDGGWQQTDYKTGSFNMVMGVYVRIDTKGNIVEYSLVFKGTEPPSKWTTVEFSMDWGNNIRQPMGRSEDMWDSFDISGEQIEKFSGFDITFVGHSKGGAEAAANAVKYDLNAVIFNSAKPSIKAYGLSANKYKGTIDAYNVNGDILSIYNETIASGFPDYFNIHWLPTQSSNFFTNHSMTSVKSGLSGNRLEYNYLPVGMYD